MSKRTFRKVYRAGKWIVRPVKPGSHEDIVGKYIAEQDTRVSAIERTLENAEDEVLELNKRIATLESEKATATRYLELSEGMLKDMREVVVKLESDFKRLQDDAVESERILESKIADAHEREMEAT